MAVATMRGPWIAVAALVASLGSCGGGEPAEPAEVAASADALHATLGIISTNIDTDLAGAGFADAVEGQWLAVGDRVRTDDTGFAEVTYHDGSWQRVEARATLTVVALSEQGDVRSVATAVDIGRSWNNVRELSDDGDSYELETPVATAAVRGTRFATVCPTRRACTFSVVEGTVVVTSHGGSPIELQAGESLTVTVGEPPGGPEPLDPDDPWIVRNVGLDAERTDADDSSAGAGGTTLGACQVFSAEEATYLADQRDDGRTTGGLVQEDPSEGPSGSAERMCTWSAPPTGDLPGTSAGYVELTLLEVDSLDDCRVGDPAEPLPGVGDEAEWYPEIRAVAARDGRLCITLHHTGSDAGTTGRDAFADAVQRILTRLAPAPPSTGGGDADSGINFGS